MALVRKTEVGRQPGEVALAPSQTLQRGAGAQAHPLARDRLTGDRAEDSAEMVRRDGELARQLGQRALGLGRQHFTSGIDQGATATGALGPAGGHPPTIGALEHARSERDRSLDELVRIAAATGCGEQQSVLDVKRGRGR